MATVPGGRVAWAEKACIACKKNKRRCNKVLPECSQCRRNGRICEYAVALVPPATAAALSTLQTRLGELEARLVTPISNLTDSGSSSVAVQPASFNDVGKFSRPGSSNPSDPSSPSGQSESEFPAALFLDIDCFVWSGLQLPVPSAAIPLDVLTMLSKGNFVMETSATYFGTIHTWLPIVSKKRIDLGVSLRNGGPDIALLFLAMRLITAQSAEVADGSMYLAAKRFLGHLEGAGVVSLLCLQSMVLIALYEYSHAIYPAAWMSIGACARYAEIMGLSCGDMDGPFMRGVTTWTEVEERRRVWWAIFILDRLVSMGSKRSCCSAEPPGDGRLPTNDETWESGNVNSAWGHAVSTPYEVPQSNYARLCQAAMYVGRAEDCARNKQETSSLRIANAMSLSEELIAFGVVLDNTPGRSKLDNLMRLVAPRCLVGSALFIVLDSFTCPEKLVQASGYVVASSAKYQEELDMQSYAMEVLQLTTKQAHEASVQLLAMMAADESVQWPLGMVSPFVLDLLYCAMSTLHWLLAETGDACHRPGLQDLTGFAEMLGARWKLSRKYLELADFHNR